MPIDEVTWRGVPAVRLRDGGIAVAVAPSYGARITSLLDEEHDREWFIGSEGSDVTPVRHGSEYVAQPLGGWDEMLPTIDACVDPVTGGELPDHGDVWSLGWEVLDAPDAIATRIHAPSLPLELVRTITIPRPGAVALRYRLRNAGERALFWLWAAHPLFRVTQDARLDLPGVDRVIEVAGPDVPPGGRTHTWPPLDGEAIDRVDPKAEAHRKIFVPPDHVPAGAALRDGSRRLAMTWDLTVAPYLGVWIDGAALTPEGTIAIEPMSAYYDSLATAVEAGRAPQLAPGATLSWWVEMTLS